MANGGIVGPQNTTTQVVASGVWRLEEQLNAIKNFLWPPEDLHVLIGSSTVAAGGAASITFSNIPQTYKHLRIIMMIAPATGINQINAVVNNDTTANYTWHQLYGNGTAGSNSGVSSQTAAAMAPAPYSSTVPSVQVSDLLDYTSTSKFKVFRGVGGTDANGTGQVALRSAMWKSTSAVTSIKFSFDTAVNLPQYTTINLYGTV